MATFTLFNSFAGKLGDGTIDLDTHTFKCALTNVAPVATNTVLADITQIAAGNGYSSGGVTLTGLVYTEPSAGVWSWDSDNIFFTATGGTMATFRYLVIYDDTSASDNLVGYYDAGSQSLPDGLEFEFKVNANGHILATKSP